MFNQTVLEDKIWNLEEDVVELERKLNLSETQRRELVMTIAKKDKFIKELTALRNENNQTIQKLERDCAILSDQNLFCRRTVFVFWVCLMTVFLRNFLL